MEENKSTHLKKLITNQNIKLRVEMDVSMINTSSEEDNAIKIIFEKFCEDISALIKK